MANIRCVNIRKSYGGHTVIENLNLDIADQEFVVFLGPSGCGKSTMLRMIAGLEEITDGSVNIGDRDVTHLHPGERGVAMVFQSYALYPHMTVEDNIAFGLRRQKVAEEEIARRVRHVAGLLGLESLLARKPKNLSGGQQQRVAMARAMIKTPKLFLFDEPLSNLDAALRVATRLEIAKLHRSMHDTTMIYVTHDQVEAMTLADRICVLRDGRVEQIGTPLELYEAPVNTFVAGFIGSPKMNFIGGRLAESHGAHSIGIRPEHIVVSDGAGGWTGEIVHSEMLGSDSYIYVDIGADEPLVVREEGVSHRATGETLKLSPLPEHIHRFDQAGVSLRRAETRGAA